MLEETVQDPAPESGGARSPPSQETLAEGPLASDRLARASGASPAAAPAVWQPGAVLGHYRLEALLGSGGFGEVFLAEDRRLGRKVALKTLLPRWAGHAELRERFLKEAQVLATMDHASVVRILELGESDLAGRPWFAMELVADARPLDKLLEEGWTPSPREAAQLAAGFARAVAHVHERGFVHRDIKPANVLVQGEGGSAVKLIDLGIAKEETASLGFTGTPAYQAPEVASAGLFSPASDVYALGVVLYELLINAARPWGEMSRFEYLAGIRAGRYLAPRALDPALPRDLEEVVLKAIAREANERYQSAAELAADLEAWLEGRVPAAARLGAVARGARSIRRFMRRHRGAVAAASAIALLVLAAVLGPKTWAAWDTGWIRAAQAPPEARIFASSLDGEPVAEALARETLALRTGTYRIRIYAPGKAPWIREVAVKRRREENLVYLPSPLLLRKIEIPGPERIQGLLVFDADNDGLADFLAGQAGVGQAPLLALRAWGEKIWSFEGSKGPRPYALLDLDGDGTLEILVRIAPGRVAAVRASDGLPLWAWASARREAAFVAADLDGDGRKEIVAAVGGRGFSILDGATGKVLREIPDSKVDQNTLPSRFLATDSDGDGRDEVFLLAPRGLACYSGPQLAQRWMRPRNEQALGLLAALDTNGDGRDELYASQGIEDIHPAVLDASTGNTRWISTLPSSFGGSEGAVPAARDLDHDGRPEVLVPGPDGVLYRLDGQSGALVSTVVLGSASEPIQSSPLLFDPEGKGRLQIVAVTAGCTVHGVDAADFSLLWSYRIEGSTHVELAAADFDGDGDLEVAAAAGSTIHILSPVPKVAWVAPAPDGGTAGFDLAGPDRVASLGSRSAGVQILSLEDGRVLQDGGGPAGSSTWIASGAMPGGKPWVLVQWNVTGARAHYLLTGGSAPPWRDWTSEGWYLRARPVRLEDGTLLLAEGERGLVRLDPTDGRLLWSFDVQARILAAPEVLDLDGRKLAALPHGGGLELIDIRDGALVASGPRGSHRTRPAFADFTGDGRPELAAVSARGEVRLLDLRAHGSWVTLDTIAEADVTKLAGRSSSHVEADPAAGDLDGDGTAELLMATYKPGDSSEALALSFRVVSSGRTEARVLWQAKGLASIDEKPLIYEDEEGRVRVLLTDEQGLLTIFAGDGKRLAWRALDGAEANGLLLLPAKPGRPREVLADIGSWLVRMPLRVAPRDEAVFQGHSGRLPRAGAPAGPPPEGVDIMGQGTRLVDAQPGVLAEARFTGMVVSHTPNVKLATSDAGVGWHDIGLALGRSGSWLRVDVLPPTEPAVPRMAAWSPRLELGLQVGGIRGDWRHTAVTVRVNGKPVVEDWDPPRQSYFDSDFGTIASWDIAELTEPGQPIRVEIAMEPRTISVFIITRVRVLTE